MNSNVSRTIVQMEADELVQLTSEVKETVATGIKVDKQGTFSVTDLWNIRRNRKTQYLHERAVFSRRSTIV